MCGYILYVCSGVCVFGSRGGGAQKCHRTLSKQLCLTLCQSNSSGWRTAELPSHRSSAETQEVARVCARVLAACARPVTTISSHGTMVVSMSCLRAVLGADIHYPGRPQAKLRCASQAAAEPPLDSGQAKEKKKQKAKAVQVNLNPFIQRLSALIGCSPIT